MVFGIAAAIPFIARTGFALTTRVLPKTVLGNVVSGASFGAPYAFSTYVGFPGNYIKKSNYTPTLKSQYSYNFNMPYYSYPRRYRSRYGPRRRRYGYRRYYRRY